jgi:hypothetical protein
VVLANTKNIIMNFIAFLEIHATKAQVEMNRLSGSMITQIAVWIRGKIRSDRHFCRLSMARTIAAIMKR